MAILDVFKRKKIKKEEERRQEEIKSVKKPKEIKKEVVPKKEKRTVIGEAYRIIGAPRVTEKATDLAKGNQYVFRVFAKANKTEIKKAVEDLYNVDVLNVEIIRVPRKRRRLGRISGWRKGYKKAIIRIKEGQKIEVLPR